MSGSYRMIESALHLALAAALVACGSTGEDASDVLDRDQGPVGQDAGPEPCPVAGAVEVVACGNCGTTERFCTADGFWDLSAACEDEGECAPGDSRATSCGNCGSQMQVCGDTCAWEPDGTCSGGGECAPGATLNTGEGCTGDERRELTCSDACIFETTAACAPEPCDSPGASETVPCGTMCGTQQRICAASGTWTYAECTGEGECVRGSAEIASCGMCGTIARSCDGACTWIEEGICSGEGVCVPGTQGRTSSGCSPGQARTVECDAGCALSVEVEACSATNALDVLLLMDVTQGRGAQIRNNATLFESQLLGPLLDLGDVAVGIAYFADFPVTPYGHTGDPLFLGGVEPTTDYAALRAALRAAPLGVFQADAPEAMVEALSIVTGGSPPASASPLTCSAFRESGGCWRDFATNRVVITYTDAPAHNGPDPAGSGLYSAYSGVTPPPARWSDVASRMNAQGTELIALVDDSGFLTADLEGQIDEMLADLGQPTTNRRTAGPAMLGFSLGTVVERIRVLGGY